MAGTKISPLLKTEPDIFFFSQEGKEIFYNCSRGSFVGIL
jgi:hypothetical protein